MAFQLQVKPLAPENYTQIQGGTNFYGPQTPAYSPLPISTGGDAGGSGGYSYGGGYSYSPPDPYAKWGGKAGYDQAVNDYNAQKNSTFGSIGDRIGSEGSKYNSTILDFLDSIRQGQGRIDSKAVQNELSKRQGGAGILDMVGRGLRSGGVMLAGKNATTSSAAGELARAWGDIGQRDMAGVNNQYEQGNAAIAQDQADFQLQEQQGLRHIGENKNEVINSIVSDAQTAIAGLNSAAATASLPDRIDIEAKKQEVRSQALAKLQEYDAALNSGVAGIKPSSQASNKAKAASLDTAGVAATNPFNFDTSVPTQFQGTGPFASDLPIFTLPSGKKNQKSAGA